MEGPGSQSMVLITLGGHGWAWLKKYTVPKDVISVGNIFFKNIFSIVFFRHRVFLSCSHLYGAKFERTDSIFFLFTSFSETLV